MEHKIKRRNAKRHEKAMKSDFNAFVDRWNESIVRYAMGTKYTDNKN